MMPFADKIFQKFSALRSPKEKKESGAVQIETIDENSRSYPYRRDNQLGNFIFIGGGGIGTGSAANGEKSYGEEGQRQIGREIAAILGEECCQNGVIDVGYGTNCFVGEGIHQATGTKVVLLDMITGMQKLGKMPGKVRSPVLVDDQPGTPRYCGDFRDIDDRKSELAKRKFGAIIFNGSWSAAGNNFTVMEHTSSRFHELNRAHDYSYDEAAEYNDAELQKMLDNAVKHLAPGGKVVITSSRFALHGDGFGFDSLLEEKLHFLNTIDMMAKSGATKITLVGASNEGVQDWLNLNMTDEMFRLKRFASVFYEIFHGDTMGKRMELIVKGEPLSTMEIAKMCEDEDRMREIMNTPGKFHDQMMAEVEKRNEWIRQNVQRLTGGVEGLPDNLERGLITTQRIKTIKENSGKLIPDSLARIDAIIAEF